MATPPAEDSHSYTPIAALTTNSQDWIIKARVTKKYDKRTWNNARGKGYLMNIDLIDAYGSQIQATFFKEAVDKFEGVIR
jgi:replication factor A1